MSAATDAGWKPCPFCGGGKFSAIYPKRYNGMQIQCLDCGIKTRFPVNVMETGSSPLWDAEKASDKGDWASPALHWLRDRWNRRHGDDV